MGDVEIAARGPVRNPAQRLPDTTLIRRAGWCERQKIRMIGILLSGVVDPVDVDAIERLLSAVTDAAEMNRLDNRFGPEVKNINDFALRARLRAVLGRRP